MTHYSNTAIWRTQWQTKGGTRATHLTNLTETLNEPHYLTHLAEDVSCLGRQLTEGKANLILNPLVEITVGYNPYGYTRQWTYAQKIRFSFLKKQTLAPSKFSAVPNSINNSYDLAGKLRRISPLKRPDSNKAGPLTSYKPTVEKAMKRRRMKTRVSKVQNSRILN